MVKLWKGNHLNINYPLNYVLTHFPLLSAFAKQITILHNTVLLLYKKTQFVYCSYFNIYKRRQSFCQI